MSQQTELFTVRIWREEINNKQWEIRGRVRHVSSGECRHFRSWDDLRAFLDTRSDSTVTGGNP